MFCATCGKEQPDDASFCDACGARLCDEVAEVELPVFPQEGGSPEESETDVSEEAATNASHQGKPFKYVAIGIVIVLIVAAVIAWLFISSIPPVLSEENALSDVDAVAIAPNIEVSSAWADGSGFSFASKTVDSIEDSAVQNERYKTVYITAIFENASFRATCRYENVYHLEDRAWVLNDGMQLSQDLEPRGGVSDDKVIEQVSSFMKQIDENPHKDADGNKQYLLKLYTEGIKFEVAENNTSASGGDVKINISSQDGVASYAGVLSVSFEWSGTDWKVNGCSVDDAAYVPDYSSMIGTWTGEFQETDGKCYAGRNAPPVLTVKSVDAVGKTAVVDITFVVHGHKYLSNVSDSTEGDQTVNLTDVLIEIKQSSKYYQIQSGEVSDGVAYGISLKTLDTGSLSMAVGSFKQGTGWSYSTSDTFIMSKSSVDA